MKHIVVMLIIAAAIAGCSHRYSKYGYEPPPGHSQKQ